MTSGLYSYAEFQISDTLARNAKAEVEAVFVTPFEGVDLVTVPDQDRDSVEAMRKQAEDAETELLTLPLMLLMAKKVLSSPSLHRGRF